MSDTLESIFPCSPFPSLQKENPKYWNRLYHNNHDGRFTDVSGSTCNTRGEVVYSYAAQSAECHDVMSVYHYYTKSAEDWDLKRRRGKADALDPLATPYDNAVFEVMSYDATVHDISAKRFIPRLHALLQANGAGR